MSARKYESPSDVKIGVYTIMCNEAKFVDQWVNAHRQADAMYVLVNNSTDDTAELLKIYTNTTEQGKLFVEEKKYDTFRFDVARNDNLAMIPSIKDGGPDVLIQVDADETLQGSWYEDIQRAAFEHPNFKDMNYYYAWSHVWDKDGKPHDDRVIAYNKCHRNDPGAKWEFPVHETLCYTDEYCKESIDGSPWITDKKGEKCVYLHHWADNTKSRGSYLKLLELRAEENPNDTYGKFYLGREYGFYSMWEKSLKAYIGLYASLENSNDDMLMLCPLCNAIADTFSHFKGKEKEVEFFYKRAIELAPTLKDSYIFYAQWLAYQGRPLEALDILNKSKDSKIRRYYDWREFSYTWSTWKEAQIKADAYCYLGEYELAWDIISKACLDLEGPLSGDRSAAAGVGFFSDFRFIKERCMALGIISVTKNSDGSETINKVSSIRI